MGPPESFGGDEESLQVNAEKVQIHELHLVSKRHIPLNNVGQCLDPKILTFEVKRAIQIFTLQQHGPEYWPRQIRSLSYSTTDKLTKASYDMRMNSMSIV